MGGEGGHRRKAGKMKTMPLADSEATHVGAAPPGWEVETTMVGAPPGWDNVPTDPAADVPADWEADRTFDETKAAPAQPPPHPSRRAKQTPDTVLGPGPSHDLGAGQPADRQLEKPRRSSEPTAARPPIEVEVRKMSSAAMGRTPPAYEIWTKNRVYALDAGLACCDVIDLASGQSDRRHPFIGGQLVGGQRRFSESTELTFPLPTPGSEAVFQMRDSGGHPRLASTSKVTRVILHVQVVRVSEQQRDTTWHQITSSRAPGADPK